MLDFAIFAVTFVVVMIVIVLYLYPTSNTTTSSIPGLSPTDSKEGNYLDIRAAGSLHSFLVDLHEDYGPIASFWMGTSLVVSVASPENFRQHQHTFDRPQEMYELYQPVLGKNSILYTNGSEARMRLKFFQEFFNGDNLKNLTPILDKLTRELGNKWSTLDSKEHVPLLQYMKAFCLKSAVYTLFGNGFFNTDQKIVEFSRNFEKCFSKMESELDEAVADKEAEKLRFEVAVKNLRQDLRKSLERLQTDEDRHNLLNVFKNSSLSEEIIIDDLITTLFFYYSMSCLLSWALYFISTNDKAQKKIHEGIKNGDGAYLLAVVKETLRLAPIFSWTTRTQNDLEAEIGGFTIPKGTPVIHAISVVMSSDKYWSMPKLFDPDRFAEDDHNLAFVPFGFAGKRKCPAEDFIYQASSLFLEEICRKFVMKSVEDQVVTPVYGIVTKPEEEIWITVEKRK